MRTIKNIGLSFILIAVIFLSSSCGKEEKNIENSNSLNKLDYKTEFVEVNSDDWGKISNQYYQTSLESDIVKTYKSVKYIRVYKKLTKQDYGTDGIWQELPFDNFGYEFVNDKIYVHCYDYKLAANSMFKLEIKVEGSVSANDYAEVQKSTVDQYISIFNEFIQTKHDLEKGFQSFMNI